jgi:alanyl-tRNA synthetase
MELADELREKLGTGVGVLAAEVDGKGALLVVVTDDLIGQGVKAGDLVKELAAIAGGTGGGRPHLAQAGTKETARLDDAIAAAPDVVAKQLD